MPETRHHPDLFSPDEAAAYLHLDSTATLDTFRQRGWLEGYRAGKGLLYWRADLDDCALRIVGAPVPARAGRKALKLAE